MQANALARVKERKIGRRDRAHFIRVWHSACTRERRVSEMHSRRSAGRGVARRTKGERQSAARAGELAKFF